MPSSAVEIPRHLSAQSSSSSSPAHTPPAQSSGLRSSTLPVSGLSSPAIGSSSNNVPLPSPSTSASNRFGLALNFMQRRPRGLTNPSSMTPTGGRSPVATGSPGSELPPSPNGGERSGYGFPALRRTLSKRGNNGGTSSPQETTSSRSRTRRSSSQPPPPVGMQTEFTGRMRSATGETVSGNASASASGTSVNATGGAVSDTPVQTPALEVGNSVGASATGTSAQAIQGNAEGSATQTYRIRLVPHLESSRSLHFEPIDREVAAHRNMRVGRFTDRSHHNNSAESTRIAFKSKVVSRGHAEIWADDAGKFFIKDTKSSSGSFLNHIRLSAPNTESRAFPLKDGDVLQLGVDYQGGTEEIYRCVKMRVELNRGWQRGNNAFNTAALAQLRALGSQTDSAQTPGVGSVAAKRATGPVATVTDCCICLYPVTVCQALFIAPCSHVTHFKCIRPLVENNYPGFCCPLCRTYADLEADVEIEPWEPEVNAEDPAPATLETAEEQPEAEEAAAAAAAAVDDDEAMSSVEEADEPASRPASRPASVRQSRPASLAAIAVPGEGSPLASPVPSGLSRSRPGSLRNGAVPSKSNAPPLPLPIDTHAQQMDTLASLASAATPPNSTFLSTLADGRLPRVMQASRHPVSLDMALAQAGPSSTTVDTSEGRPNADRSSFGSEDETDGAREDEDVGDRVSAGASKGVVVIGTSKGKRRAGDEGEGKEKELDDDDMIQRSARNDGGKGKEAQVRMQVDQEQDQVRDEDFVMSN